MEADANIINEPNATDGPQESTDRDLSLLPKGLSPAPQGFTNLVTMASFMSTHGYIRPTWEQWVLGCRGRPFIACHLLYEIIPVSILKF